MLFRRILIFNGKIPVCLYVHVLAHAASSFIQRNFLSIYGREKVHGPVFSKFSSAEIHINYLKNKLRYFGSFSTDFLEYC